MPSHAARVAGLAVLVLLALAGLPGCGGEASAPAITDARTRAWQRDVLPVLEEQCVSCHSGAEPEGSLDLEPVASGTAPSPQDLRAEAQHFSRMASHVAEGLMPPPSSLGDEGGPRQEARDAFSSWIEDELAAAWASAPPNPGRVTMRRLSRYEYGNTVRDLLGVTYDVEAGLPPDEVGYGFDHIGDVLSMPPLLFEKYLAAAEAIAAQALPVVQPEQRAPQRIPAAELEISPKRGRAQGSGVVLFSNGSVSRSLFVPAAGRYRIRVSASAQQAGPDAARMEIRGNRRVLRSVSVEATPDAPRVYEIEAVLPRGHHVLSAAFTNDYYAPKHKDPRMRGDRNLLVHWVESEGPLGDPDRDLHERFPLVCSCDPLGEDPSCLQTIVADLLARAFRRPPTQAQVTRHLSLVLRAQEAGETVGGSLQALLEALLLSPHFLFRVELDERVDPGAAVEALDDHALASRLSYFLWSSLPDASLRAAADAGTLRASVHAHTTRMLADPKARALVENFATQWLELRRLDRATPDRQLHPSFSEPLRSDMREETERFFEVILREDRNILDLLDAPFTFLNERLATHYGIPGVEGNAFRRVELADGARGGLLGHGSILTLTSYPTRTSVVQRGKWVMEELLGTPPPPPPPGVGTLEEQAPEMLKLSLRERLAAHRENPDCAVCHDRMDNLGYGLEPFDAVGGWRLRDGANPIDSAGVLPDGRSFSGPQELKQLLRADPNVPRCFAEKLLTYALGRGLEPYDGPAVRQIVEEARAQGLRFSAFVHAIVASDAFTMRRSSGGSK